MPSTTPVAGLRYAVQTDTPVAQTLAQNLATDLDRQLIPVYATTAARDTAIPSPTQGMFCYVSATAAGTTSRTLQFYDGSAWIPMYRAPLFAYKTADETITSSTAQQTDDHLVVAVQANAIYQMNLWLLIDGDAAGDFQFNISFPALTAVSLAPLGPGTTITSTTLAENTTFSAVSDDTSSPTTARSIGLVAASSMIGARIEGLVVVGATAGNVSLLWYQGTSSANSTVLKKHSYMNLARVA